MTPANSCAWYITFSVGSTIWVSDISVGIQWRFVLRERLSGDDGEHAWDLQRPLGVDRLDARVGERAADDVQEQHARELDVVHVAALPADEPRVLLALDRVAHASDFGCRSRRHHCPPS